MCTIVHNEDGKPQFVADSCSELDVVREMTRPYIQNVRPEIDQLIEQLEALMKSTDPSTVSEGYCIFSLLQDAGKAITLACASRTEARCADHLRDVNWRLTTARALLPASA